MRRWVWGIVAVALVGLAYVAWPYGRFAYLMYFYGPPALERMAVSAPTLSYRYGPAPQQMADLRLPSGRGPFAVAVVVHGGCWDAEFGDRRVIAPLADALTKRGIATVNVEYRRVGEPGGGWPGTMRDTGAATDSVSTLR